MDESSIVQSNEVIQSGSPAEIEKIKPTTGTEIQWPPGRVPPENLQKYQAQIETFKQKKVDAQEKVNKLNEQIADIKESCLSIRQMLVSTAIAAIAVTVAGTLLAFIANPLVIGIALGVIAFVAVGYLLYQNNCSKRAQIEILQQLMMAQGELGNANNELAAACSNLLNMEVKVTEQGELITEQGQTVEEQLKQLAEQATKISTLEQNNAKLEQNLQAVQQAREDAEKKVKEITDTAKTLKESLEAAQTHMQALEEKAKGLEQTNAEQAAELHKQAEAMKAFVDGQQTMVRELQTVLGENKSHLDAMMKRTEECSNDVSGKLETIKNYVRENFEEVQNDLKKAAAALEKMTVGTGGKQPDAGTIARAQKEVTEAIVASVVKLGTMQEHIITSLTAAQTALSGYKKEMETKVAQADKDLADCGDKLMALSREAFQMQEKINDVNRKKELADVNLKRIQDSSTGDQKSGWLGRFAKTPLENAQAEANKIQQELDNLQGSLQEQQGLIAKAQERVQEAREASKAIEEENKRIASSCEELKAQNAKLVDSNNKLYDYIQSTRTNVQAAGESIDRASQNVDAAATNVANINVSRWGVLGTALGAGGTAAAASAFGGGAMIVGGAAAVGVLAPMALAFAAAYVGKAAFGVLTKRIMGAS